MKNKSEFTSVENESMRIALSCLLSTICLCAPAVPRVEIPPQGIAFGEITAGVEAKGSLELSNSGDSPLGVSRVKACCGATAELVPMTVPAGDRAMLTVSLKPQLPGEFSKSVTISCDDPRSPVVVIPVTGVAVEGRGPSAASRFTLPAILLAGFVDGFNPCSFAIMISLAGILAIGGRRRRARIAGGLAFCAASFLTYMLMGLGLMQALRALEGLRLVHDVALGVLALALFVLSFLSFRDAARFKKVPVFTVVTLKLPEGVKNLIRTIAMSSWSGPAVVLAGFGCGFLVTLLDALCTGQVYVPALALISREPGAWRSFALLVAYNLAFIAPLVAVFVLASRTTDAFRMAKWSSRNVIPAKIALGVVFLVLGVLVFPRVGGRLADALHPRRAELPPVPVAESTAPRVRVSAKSPAPEVRAWETADPSPAVSRVCGGDGATADRYEARNDALRSIARRRDLADGDVAALMSYVKSRGGSLRPEREAALRNDVLNLLRNQRNVPEGLVGLLLGIAADGGRDPALVDYAFQHLGALQHDIDDDAVRTRVRAAFVRAAKDVGRPFAGTALYSLADAPRPTPDGDAELRRLTLALLAPGAHPLARLSAVQLAGERGYREALPAVRGILTGDRRDAVQDIAAVGALGLIGEASDAALVRAALERGGSRLRPAAETALKRIVEREGGAVK